MRYVRILVLMAISAVMVAAATSCKKDGKLVGTWEYKGERNTTYLTFNKGGNGTAVEGMRYPTEFDNEGNPTGWKEEKGDPDNFTWTLNKTTLIITVSEEEGERKSESSSIGFFDGKMLIVNGDKFSKK